MDIPSQAPEEIVNPATPLIDVKRLKENLGVTDEELAEAAAKVALPDTIIVPSKPGIKPNIVAMTLDILYPGRKFDIVPIPTGSSTTEKPVGEQPVGDITIRGAMNRLEGALAEREKTNFGEDPSTRAVISIENGIFRVATDGTRQAEPSTGVVPEGATVHLENLDWTRDYDPNAEYDDAAIIAMQIPVRPGTIIQATPDFASVRFPKVLVAEAHDTGRGFQDNTVGSLIAAHANARGENVDKQNPHPHERPGYNRHEQLAAGIILGLVNAARDIPAVPHPNPSV